MIKTANRLEDPSRAERSPSGDSASEDWHRVSRDELVLRYAPMVKYVASRVSIKLPNSVDLDDLYQAGILGLIDAVSKFEPERGIKFQTYAEFRIRGAILDELRSMDWVPRAVRHAATQIEEAYRVLEARYGRIADDTEVANFLGVALPEFYEMLDTARSISIISFDDLRPHAGSDEEDDRDVLEMLADPSIEDPVERMGLQDLRRAIGSAIDNLPEKERLVVTLYYFEELTMQEIGHVMKLTESRISQLHSKATLRMRARIRQFRGG